MPINRTLFNLASARRASNTEKVAVVPPPPPAPPNAPMDPAADPAAMGAVPPVDPAQAAAGAAPPEADPAAAGAPMDPNDPAMMGGLPPEPPPEDPAASGPPAAPKMKPEQMFQALEYRMYNLQQQLTAIINYFGVTVPSEALILPPGVNGAPQAEDALPGGPMDPANAAGAQPKQAQDWWSTEEKEKIGSPISKELETQPSPLLEGRAERALESLQDKAAAALILRNRKNAR